MRSRLGFSSSKKRAVENALGRLGMQAKPEEVVAALAQQGIEVNEELVNLVRIGLLKATARMQGQPSRPHASRSQVRRRTTPAPRTRR